MTRFSYSLTFFFLSSQNPHDIPPSLKRTHLMSLASISSSKIYPMRASHLAKICSWL